MCSAMIDLMRCIRIYIQHTHPDFDDLTVKTVQHNNNITGVRGGIGSIMPEEVDKEWEYN